MIKKNNLAPITLFVYNRPDHTRNTIEALLRDKLSEGSELYVFSDGPKKLEDEAKVKQVREYIKNIKGFKRVIIKERQDNIGLANSIISGVTEIVNEYGKIIVLEDDLITSKHFLEYMNEALNLYEKDDGVISIHGFTYPTKENLPETFFLHSANSWGWATWKRGWDLFEADGQKLLNEIISKKLTNGFDFNGSYPYTQMLKDQINKRNNSWAIRWYASAFVKNKLTLYPRESLVYNDGFDGSGTHCGNEDNVNKSKNVENIKIEIKKIDIKENTDARLAIINYFKSQHNYFKNIVKKIIKTILPNWVLLRIRLWSKVFKT